MDVSGVNASDVDAVTTAVLAASRLLIAITVRSLNTVQGRVTLPQFRMLVALATRGETKAVALADDLGVNPSTTTRMVERLVTAGLIDRHANPASRREILLRVTLAGRQIVDDVTARRRKEIADIVAGMPPSQRSGLIAGLTSFIEASGEPAVGRANRDAISLQ